MFGEVRLQHPALSLSGPHSKSIRAGDRLYEPMLDPRTGEPTAGALLAAVDHDSATLTDALSTALLVLGAPNVELLVAEQTPEGVWFHSSGPDRWYLRMAGDK